MAQLPTLKHTEASDGTQKHKDYNLRAINLLSSGIAGTLDLKHMMIELSYFEDIYSHAISGKLFISDALGVIENAQLHGNEYIRMSFAKDSDDSPELYIDKIFRVYKISDRQKMDNDSTEGYIIHFCSDELLLSEQYRISKSYPGKTIKDIIIDVLVNYLKVPKDRFNISNIQDTLGTYSFIIPGFKPFEAIQWLSNYARPADTSLVGSDMLFFENAKNGYVFSSMQTMFSKTPEYNFKFGVKNRPMEEFDNMNDYFFNVLSYEYDKTFDVLDGIHNGTFANRLISLDILQHSVNITDYNYILNNKKTLNSSPVVNNLKNRFGQALYETPEGLLRLSMSNSNQSDNPFIAARPGSVSQDIFAETYVTQRKSQLAINNYTRLKIVIPGNPTVSIGQTAMFDIISTTPDEQKENDKFYSGKYLISSIRHTIQTGGYNTVIELIKDSNNKPYNKVDNNSQVWKNTVAGVKK